MTEATSSGSLIQDRYHLLDPLGSGGMGVVYLGWDVVLRRYVAVKRVRSPEGGTIDDGESWRAFREEAQLVAGFRHPGIVGVFDFGVDEDGVFIVTELVEGFDLERLVEARDPCNELATALIGYEVSGALHAAHAARIIHRDVKPSNVMVDASGRVLLMDFGIALRGDSAGGDIRGTPLYMAPEQFQGAQASSCTDLWGLGCTLAWLLTGKPPVAARNLTDLGSRLRAGDWEPELRSLLDRGGAMAGVLGACLEVDPARRYDDARVLQGALGQIIQASLVPDPREELSRAAGEWLGEMGEAVFRIPEDPPPEASPGVEMGLDDTLEAPGPSTPTAATPHRRISRGGPAQTETFSGRKDRTARISGGQRSLSALWILLVAAALAGAVVVAGSLLGPAAQEEPEDAVETREAPAPEVAPEDRRGVAIWVHRDPCPGDRAETLAGAALALGDRWPEVEVLGPQVIRGLLASDGAVTDADLLDLARAQGWRVLVTGRCGISDRRDEVSAAVYDLRWDPPLRSGDDLALSGTGEDEVRLLDLWRRGLASRIRGLLPMGCEGSAAQLPSREAARLLSRARALVPRYTREDFDEALRLVERALEDAPDAPDLRLLKARLLVLLVDRFAAAGELLDEASSEVAAAAAVCPGHRQLHRIRAIIQAKRGDSEAAIRLLKEGLERYPTDPESWNLLAVELGIAGRAREKVDALRRVLGRNPRDWNARINLGFTLRQLGDYAAAEAEYRSVLDGSANLDERLWARDGILWTALSRGDRAAARAQRDALNGERNEHWTLESAAALAWFEGSCADAVRLGALAGSKSPGAWVGALWSIVARLGDPACGGRGAAAAAAAELTALPSWPPTGQMVFGLLLDSMGRAGAADRALRRLGASRRALAAEAAAVTACREGNAVTALAQIDRAMAEDTADAATRLRRRARKVRILGALGRYDEAVRLAETCVDLVSAPDWWMYPGQPPRPEAWAAVLSLTDTGKALTLAAAAVRYEPMDPEAWLALGLAARARSDDVAEADARRRYLLLNPAVEWMERSCGAAAFKPMADLAAEWAREREL